MKPQGSSPSGDQAFLVGCVALAVSFALVGWRLLPPSSAPADAPVGGFSAARAEAFLGRLLADGQPRPTGSAANAAARERLLAELRELGLEPQVQAVFACSRSSCALVHNVLARLAGRREGGKAVLVATHYDSVGAGPGVSDDLASVAASLEVARALVAGPPLERPVVLLVDDGEEIGLLGARGFAAEHPWAAEIEAVVNLEARGTRGPSFLFETSADNDWLIRAFAGWADRPATSSIFYSVYRRLPNDTDFTVFKARGWSGVNFAFIGDVPRYHTPQDDLAHLDRRSLQHQGQNALAAVRALAADPRRGPPARVGAVYFDVLTARIVHWPIAWTLPLALFALLLLLVATRAAGRTGRDSTGLRPLSGPIDLLDRLSFGSALAGWLACALALAACWAAVWAAIWALRRFGALPVDWPASRPWSTALVWALSAFAVLLVGRALARRAGPRSVWTGWWFFFAAGGVALAVVDPSVSYVAIVPSIAAGLGGLYGGLRYGGRGVASPAAVFLPAVTLAVLLAPFAWTLDQALGVPILPALGVLSGLLVLPLLPALAAVDRWSRSPTRWVPVGLGVAAAGLFVAVASVRPLTEDLPQRLSLRLHRDATAAASHWLATPESGVLPESLAAAAAFGAGLEPILPWSRRADGYRAPAGKVGGDLTPPEVEVLASEPPLVRLRLRSPRGAPIVGLVLAGETGRRVEAVRMNGLPFAVVGKGEAAADGTRSFVSWTTPPEGVELELTLAAGSADTVFLYDQSQGLPRAAEALLRARPPTAVPSGWGDATVVSRRVAWDVRQGAR